MKHKRSIRTRAKWTRRQLLQLSGLGIVAGIISGTCNLTEIDQTAESLMTKNSLPASDAKVAREGRLSARPSLRIEQQIQPGQHSLSLEDKREALLYVPLGYDGEKPLPFALMLHGAGGNASHGIALLQKYADQSGIILLAPKSLYATWDVIADEYGVDVAYINRALEFVFERCNLDAKRLAIGGFSDGASYALSLGLINGDLFSHVVAFSPGFMALTRQAGAPEIFVSHGTEDRVLPIDRCSRRLVPQLKSAGYAVTYREFQGPHTIPVEVSNEAVEVIVGQAD